MKLSPDQRRISPNGDVPEPRFEAVTEQRTSLEGTSLSLAIADGGSSADSETVLNFMSWSGYVERPDVKDMQRVIAQALGARVVSIDNLGVGDGTDHIPEYKRLRLQQGNFGTVSRAQLDVFQQDGTVSRGDSVSLMGHSLGAAMAASFARAMPAGSHVDRLILWETAGIRHQPLSLLVGKFGLEALKWQRYLTDNPDWMNLPGKDKTIWSRMRENKAGYIDYPCGLAKGTVVADIIEARDREIVDDSTEILILHGEQSRVSSTTDNVYLVEALLANGIKPRIWQQYSDESHGIIDSANRIDAMLTEFRTT